MRTLAGIDRRSVIGKRDYALLLLGLCTGRGPAEISGLTLGDLTWADDQQRGTIPWHVHGRKQPATVRQEVGLNMALPLCEWILARLALGSPEHDYVFVALSTNGAAGTPMSLQSIRAMSKKWLGTSRRPA
jgi:integrase